MSQNFEKVTVLDPHSDVLEACINNFKGIDTIDFANRVLKDVLSHSKPKFADHLVLVSPDAGALKKVFKIPFVFTSDNSSLSITLQVLFATFCDNTDFNASLRTLRFTFIE